MGRSSKNKIKKNRTVQLLKYLTNEKNVVFELGESFYFYGMDDLAVMNEIPEFL